MKPARAIDWPETADSESDIAERCASGDAQACQDVVDTHQRMGYHLALQLLSNHDDALIEERGELPAPPGPTSPERPLDQKQLGARVWRALNRLPFDQRSAVVLRELHGLRYAEIAFSLGVSNAAVKSRTAPAAAGYATTSHVWRQRSWPGRRWKQTPAGATGFAMLSTIGSASG